MRPTYFLAKRKTFQRQKRIERKEWRKVRKVIPSLGIMEITDSVVNTEDTGEGPSMGPNKMPPLQLDPEKLTGFSDFHVEQRNYETLSQVFIQVAVIDNKEVDPLRARLYPHFVLKMDLLYCIDQDKQTQKIRTQLLVLWVYHHKLLHLAHCCINQARY